MSSTNQTSSTPGQTSTSGDVGGAGTKAAPARSGIRRRLFDGNRLHKALIVILALGCAGLYVWHMVAIHQMRSQLGDRMVASEARHSRTLAEQATTSLRLTGYTLGWAAANDLAEANLAAIDAHLTRMVQVGPVTLVAVIDQEGTVRVSSNKKLQGQTAATAFAGLPLDTEEVQVVDQDGKLMLVAPLMEDGNRIGTAVLTYARGGARAAGAPAGAE